MNMETKKKICPKCGQEDGSGQNKIHDMNPEHFVICSDFCCLKVGNPSYFVRINYYILACF